MPQDILLGAILLAPVIICTLLRINAVMVFLSLCLGDILVKYVASDANSLLAMFAPGIAGKVSSFIQVIILLLPVILTAIIMMLTVHNRSRAVLNVIPALGVGYLAVLLIVPLLPRGLRESVQGAHLWPEVIKLQSLVVGLAAVVSLFFLWMQRKRGVHEE
jgi:hypothetical protein